MGIVYLVGAGPGDPDLLTLRGAECLRRADLVLYDYLVNPAILRHARASTQLVCLGRPHGGRATPQADVERQMIEAARADRTVVRLKCGDPAVFGRGAEEVTALTTAGVPFEIVPGVTAASALFSYAGIPLTHREAASAVALVTGHQANVVHGPPLDYARLAGFPGTVVFYMGVSTSRRWSEEFVRGGRSPDTPVAIVRRVSWPDQQTYRATLGTVADVIQREQVRPPCLIVIGDTAAFASGKDAETR